MSTPTLTKFKVAAAHAAPVFMNKAATLQKVVRLIEQAGKQDVKVLVFPETFVPGYPVRLSFHRAAWGKAHMSRVLWAIGWKQTERMLTENMI
jgi:predicted amidohydrolase